MMYYQQRFYFIVKMFFFRCQQPKLSTTFCLVNVDYDSLPEMCHVIKRIIKQSNIFRSHLQQALPIRLA